MNAPFPQRQPRGVEVLAIAWTLAIAARLATACSGGGSDSGGVDGGTDQGTEADVGAVDTAEDPGGEPADVSPWDGIWREDEDPDSDTGGREDADTPPWVVTDATPLDTAASGEPPVILQLWPTHGPVGGGTLVVVQGLHYTTDIEVRLGGLVVPEVDVVDEYEIWLRTPPMEEGSYALKLTSRFGSTVREEAFRFEGSLRIYSVAPRTLVETGGEWVTIRGEGFSSSTRVLFAPRGESCGGGAAREAEEVLWVDETTLEAMAPPGPAGCGADVVAWDETLARLDDAVEWYRRPSLQRLSPSVGLAGEETEVRIDGTGIDETCLVRFGEQDAGVQRAADGWLVTRAPGGVPGVVGVSVDCGERGSDLLPEGFEYVVGSGRDVFGIWPRSGFASGGEIVSVEGRELGEATAVRFSDTVATWVDASAGRIEVIAPALEVGIHGVIVEFDDGSAVEAGEWEAVESPRFDRVAPNGGLPDGGWETTLTGSGLDALEAIEVDGREVEWVSRARSAVRFVAPGGAPGEAPIRARVAGGTLQTGLSLVYRPALRFDAFFPPTGSTAGGSVVHVSGDGFFRGCTVTIDGVDAPTSVLAPGLLSAVAPPHEEGPATLAVTGCETGWTAPEKYYYVDPTRYPGGVIGGGINGEIRVSVRDAATFAPVLGATVVVGERATSPYVALTPESGMVTFTGADLVGPQTVTAYAPSRSTESIVGVDARDVTLLLFPPPSPPCPDPTDPACAPPPPDPTGEIIGFLTGLRKIFDFPPGTTPRAIVETTELAPGYGNPDPGENNVLSEEGPFWLTTRLGDMSLVALCGYEVDATRAFVPLWMGVVRGIHIRPDAGPYRTTIDCSIPLTSTLKLKLTNAPELVISDDPAAFPVEFRAKVVLDFGGEGVFERLPMVTAYESDFEEGTFPAIAGPLADVTFEVSAGAYTRIGTIPQSVAYARNLDGFDAQIAMPPFLPLPTFLVPSVESPGIVDRYVEWTLNGDRTPDFFHIYAYSAAPGFGTWSVFVPGWQTTFNLADFPPCLDPDCVGITPVPGEPSGTVTFYVRAIDADVFDYNNFDRYVFRTSGWQAQSTSYTTFQLP